LNKIFLLSLLLSLNIFANINKTINIESDAVEYMKATNSISFLDNVRIASENINVLAKEAIYDSELDTISVIGFPSIITSTKKGTNFKGKAEKIIIYSNEKIHLVGNASMSYENINITSNKIVFNPQTGSLISEK
tara:strand:- start:143 stop:547 length:405 start_codon:yes stop_codon:yes gene_type:complete